VCDDVARSPKNELALPRQLRCIFKKLLNSKYSACQPDLGTVLVAFHCVGHSGLYSLWRGVMHSTSIHQPKAAGDQYLFTFFFTPHWLGVTGSGLAGPSSDRRPDTRRCLGMTLPSGTYPGNQQPQWTWPLSSPPCHPREARLGPRILLHQDRRNELTRRRFLFRHSATPCRVVSASNCLPAAHRSTTFFP